MRVRASFTAALVAAAGTVSVLNPSAYAGVPIDTSWQTAADGFWSNAGNWSMGAPINMGMTEYNAFITVGGAPYTVDLDVEAIINGLTINNALGEATLRLNGFNLTVNNDCLISNNNIVRGDGAGVLTFAPGSTTVFNTVRFMNIAAIHARGNTIYGGAGDEFCDTDIDHEDQIDITGPGSVVLNEMMGSTTFRIRSTATLTLSNNNSISTMMGAPLLMNEGTVLRNAAAAGTFTIEGVTVMNASTGTIRVSIGDLAVSGAGGSLDNAGVLKIDSTRTLEIVSGAALTNFAAGTLTGGEYDVAGIFRFDTGGTGIDTIDAKVTLDGAASAIQNADNSDALAGTSAITAAGELTLLNTRSITTGGGFDNQGLISIGDGSTFEVPAGSQLNNFDAGGSRTLTGGRFEVNGGGILRFDAGAMGIDTIDSEVVIVAPKGANPIRNAADASALANLDTIGDNGRFEIDGGFDFTTASSFFVAPNGQLVIGEQSVFEVPNTGGNMLVNFGGNVISDGSFEVRGVLRAPGLAVQTIGLIGNPSQIALDGQLFDGMDPIPHFQDNANNNSDAFAALQTIETGSSLSLRNGAVLTTSGSLTVRGTLNISGSTLLRGTVSPSTITIGGDLMQESGVLELGAGVITLMGDLNLGASATLAGSGQVNFVSGVAARGEAQGVLNWEGTIAPGAITGNVAGRLDIDGSVMLGEDASLHIHLGGYQPGLTHDLLALTGLADFNGPGGERGGDLGRLIVQLSGGFVPQVGDEFIIMTFGGRDGGFRDIIFDHPPAGLTLEPLWFDDHLRIVVMPGPGTWLAAPLMAWFAGRRRR